jgi:hypothetical protein
VTYVLVIYSGESTPLREDTFLSWHLKISSGLRGHKRTYLTILESADHALLIHVGTYVQRGSKFCFVVLVLGTLLRILHYCPIPMPCPAALPGSLAWQPCPAVFPGSLSRQPCPVALNGSLAERVLHCLAALPGSLSRQPCPEALPGSLARQPYPAALQKDYKLKLSQKLTGQDFERLCTY